LAKHVYFPAFFYATESFEALNGWVQGNGCCHWLVINAAFTMKIAPWPVSRTTWLLIVYSRVCQPVRPRKKFWRLTAW